MKKERKNNKLQILTFETVVIGSLPPVEAHVLALVVAHVAAEGVVPRLAPLPAALAVVVLLAGHSELVGERRVRGAVVVARPLFPEVEPPLDHQAGDQGRFWGGRERGEGSVVGLWGWL